jgi:hypothetical protein
MLLLLLVSTLVFFTRPAHADASYIPYPSEPNQELPTLEVRSPHNGEVFSLTTVKVNFTVTKPDSWNVYWLTAIPVIGYYIVYVYLDGKFYTRTDDPLSTGFPTADYSVSLYRLTRGTHTVKIDVEASTFYNDPSPEPGDYLTYSRNITETIHFTVNADLISISILSPSGTYTTPGVNDTAMDIPLIFTVNETVSWVKYRLVGSGYGNESSPFTGNSTLHQIPLGGYLLTVYVNDMSTYAFSHFNVENPSPQETAPFPTAIVIIASVVIVVLAVAGLLVYFKKRNHQAKPSG